MAPRFDRPEQRQLFATALPMALALGVGQIYFRLVIVLMSLISSPRQTGYFGGSLRAMESLTLLPSLTVGVALPLLAAAARDDRARLRYAVEGLGRASVIIGGHAFRAAGAVLRIQVGAMLFIMLYSIWSGALLALGRQRELILTNALALAAVAVFAAVLVPEFGAQGGATASVLGDALLAVLIYWRLARTTGGVMVNARFLARVAMAAAAGVATLFIPGLPNLVAAGLSGIVFLGVGQIVGMVPIEVLSAFGLNRLRLR
jgi:O-antigen/teichoic acid export membrane protein